MTCSFLDIIDIPTLQAFLNCLVNIKALPVTLLDHDGSTIVTSEKQSICSKFHTNHSQGKAICRLTEEHHQKLNHPAHRTSSEKGYTLHKTNTGIADISVPILVDKHHCATLFIGHFFYKSHLEDLSCAHAQEHGYNVDEYLNATRRIPIVSPQEIDEIIEPYVRFAQFLSQTSSKALKKTQKPADRFHSFFEISNDAIYIFDREGQILEVNQTACLQMGLSIDILRLKKIQDLWAKRNPIHFEERIREVEKAGWLVFETPYRKQDGSTFPGENSVCHFTYNGKPAYLNTCRDITLRKESEDALRKSEEELQSAHQNLQDIIDFLPDATFVIDRQGTVVAWNHAIETMTGVKAKDIVGEGDFAYALPFYGKRRPILIDLVEDQNPQLKAHYNFSITNENILHAEAYLASAYANKGAYLSGIAAPLFDHKGNHVGAIESIRDISEQKQAEETLRQRTHMLEETNTALKVLLRESADAQEELEKKVLLNMKELVLPYINDLGSLLTDRPQKVYLQTIKTNLHEITSSFSQQLTSTYSGLTPKEIQIADFIRQGKTNKEMAYLLKVSINTIDFHRRNLRDKLKIKGKKTNLRSFLLSHTT